LNEYLIEEVLIVEIKEIGSSFQGGSLIFNGLNLGESNHVWLKTCYIYYNNDLLRVNSEFLLLSKIIKSCYI